jgi:hypothetical protein
MSTLRLSAHFSLFVLFECVFVIILIPIRPAEASTAAADQISTRSLIARGYRGDQTTFNGLILLIARGTIPSRSQTFDLSYALDQFRPFTLDQSALLLRTVLQMKPTEDRRLQPDVLLRYLISEKMNVESRSLLRGLLRDSRDITIRRLAARILLASNSGDSDAIATLRKIGEPALNEVYAVPADVNLVRIQALLDLLFSTQRESVLVDLETLTLDPVAQQVLGPELIAFYARQAGPAFLRYFLTTVERENQLSASAFAADLRDKDAGLYLEVASRLATTTCDHLLTAFLQMSWRNPAAQAWRN